MKKRILISIIACSLLSGQAIHGMTSAPAVQNAVRAAPNKEAAVKLIIDNNLENKFGGAALRAFVPLYGPWATAKADYLAAAKKAAPPPPSIDEPTAIKMIDSAKTEGDLNDAWAKIVTAGLGTALQAKYNAKLAAIKKAGVPKPTPITPPTTPVGKVEIQEFVANKIYPQMIEVGKALKAAVDAVPKVLDEKEAEAIANYFGTTYVHLTSPQFLGTP